MFSRKPGVALGVSVACLAYAGSLAVQRVFPPLADVLSLSIAEGVKPTYYLRVVLSLALGAVAGALAPRRPLPEARLAWATAIALVLSVIIICAVP
jgi:hypothetical protein